MTYEWLEDLYVDACQLRPGPFTPQPGAPDFPNEWLREPDTLILPRADYRWLVGIHDHAFDHAGAVRLRPVRFNRATVRRARWLLPGEAMLMHGDRIVAFERFVQ